MQVCGGTELALASLGHLSISDIWLTIPLLASFLRTLGRQSLGLHQEGRS